MHDLVLITLNWLFKNLGRYTERQRRLSTAGARASEAASWRVRGVSGRAAGRYRAQRIAARCVEAACVLQGCIAWRALVVCLPACWVLVRGCKHVGVARLDSTGRRWTSKKEASWRDHGLEKKIIR